MRPSVEMKLTAEERSDPGFVFLKRVDRPGVLVEDACLELVDPGPDQDAGQFMPTRTVRAPSYAV